MKGEIDIESRPYSKTEYYGGTYTVKEDDINDTEFSFTICVTADENINTLYIIEWLEGSPGEDDIETEEIEQDILEQFKQQI